MPSSLASVRSIYSRRRDLVEEVRTIEEAATAETRSLSEDEMGRVEEIRSEAAQLADRADVLLEMEERSQSVDDGIEAMFGAMLDREAGDVIDTRSIGEQFATDEFRSWAEAGARGTSPGITAEMEFRAVTDVTTGATSGGAFINNQRLARVGQTFGDRRVYLLDLLPHIPVSTGSVEYVQDSSPKADLADKAVEVAEAGAKPQAGPTLAVTTETCATIAAWANITRQTAADVPQIRGYLDGRLRYSVKRRADGQSINGNGSSPNLRGLLNRSGINTYAPGSSEARYKSIRHAITLVEQDEFVPEIIVLNPADAEIFDLSNEAAAGLHAIPDGGLVSPSPRSAWGLTQVRSNAIAAGTALILDPMAVAVFDREQITAYMTDSHASNFTSNILTLLLEARLGLGLFDPEAVCSITFNGTV